VPRRGPTASRPMAGSSMCCLADVTEDGSKGGHRPEASAERLRDEGSACSLPVHSTHSTFHSTTRMLYGTYLYGTYCMAPTVCVHGESAKDHPRLPSDRMTHTAVERAGPWALTARGERAAYGLDVQGAAPSAPEHTTQTAVLNCAFPRAFRLPRVTRYTPLMAGPRHADRPWYVVHIWQGGQGLQDNDHSYINLLQFI
jgi:hypothetical protein